MDKKQGSNRNRTSAASTPSRGKAKVTLYATGANSRLRDRELRKLRTYARRSGWKVNGVYTDVGGSTSGLVALLQAFYKHRIRNILVHRLSDIPLASASIGARLMSLVDLGTINIYDTLASTSLDDRIGRHIYNSALWVACVELEQRLLAAEAGGFGSSCADPSPRLAKPSKTKPMGPRSRRSSRTVGDGRVIACTARHHLVGARRPAK
jgi:hypothetical protein